MRITLVKSIALSASALLGVAVLAGCSSSEDSSSSGSSDSSSGQDSGGDSGSQALPPVIVEPGQTEATAKVGDFIDIVVEQVVGTTISTDNPDVLEVFQASDDGSAQFNPGAKALAPGNATITVTDPSSNSYDIAVTVTE